MNIILESWHKGYEIQIVQNPSGSLSALVNGQLATLEQIDDDDYTDEVTECIGINPQELLETIIEGIEFTVYLLS